MVRKKGETKMEGEWAWDGCLWMANAPFCMWHT